MEAGSADVTVFFLAALVEEKFGASGNIVYTLIFQKTDFIYRRIN